jgi:hypothetical protein
MPRLKVNLIFHIFLNIKILSFFFSFVEEGEGGEEEGEQEGA